MREAKMIEIRVSEELLSVCPCFVGAAVVAEVANTDYSPAMWNEIEEYTLYYKNNHQLEDVKKNANIAATRDAYKKLGKDPNRYRPSSEALCRRILRDLPLYKINTLVDMINLVSIKTGYSIGGFDMDKIQGSSLMLGVGAKDESFEAIGRGMLNIEGLPVYRDSYGGIGTPTSDEERTKLDVSTTRLLTIINGYGGEAGLQDATNYMKSLLEQYVKSEKIDLLMFGNGR